MTDLKMLALAIVTWLGVLLAAPVPIEPAVAAVVVGLTLRSPSFLLLGAFALASTLGASANADYRIIGNRQYDGMVTAVALPDVATFGELLEVKISSGERVLMSVSPGAGSVRSVRTGDRIAVKGSLRGIEDSGWYRSRHLEGRLTAATVRRSGPGGPHWRLAAALQRTVEAGAASFGSESAALYTGLVTGDDRNQGAAQRAIFRRVGLSHILAVSGQNVAFLLIIMHFGLGYFPRLARPVAVFGVLALFALVTQLEPSVLRATVTAGVGYWATVTGRAGSGVRLLSLAVSVLLLLDPFLAHTIGFQLSVLAAGGILLLGPAVANRLPGPPWLRIPLAVTMAAQLAVAPLLIGAFGDVSLVSLPANLLAGWAAGLVMMWGMSIGLVAGVVGGSLGAAIQLPVRLLLWWIDGVAGVMAEIPLPPVTPALALVALAGAVVLALVNSSVRPYWLAAVLVVTLAFTGVFPIWPDSGVPTPVKELVGGATFVDGGSNPDVVVLDAGADARVVQSVLALNPSLLIVVVKGGNRSMSVVVRELAKIADLSIVLAPPQHKVVGGKRVLQDVSLETAPGLVLISAESATRLAVKFPETEPTEFPIDD